MAGRTRIAGTLRRRAAAALMRLVEPAVAERVDRTLAAEREAAARRAEELLVAALAEADRQVLHRPRVWGDSTRLSVGKDVHLNDALLNVESGTITIEEAAFMGHGVQLLTGTHDVSAVGLQRQRAVPDSGRDIVVERGAWIASRAVVLGPCRIGAGAVVAAGAVVTHDVAPGEIVGGVPARPVGQAVPAALARSEALDTDAGSLHVHPHDRVITPALRDTGRWEPEEAAALLERLSSGATFLDVGANIGYLTALGARAVGPAGRVVAVEPDSDNFALLRANTAGRGLTQVELVNAAAWDRAGTVTLTISEENTGDHRVAALADERRTVEVTAVVVDDLLPEPATVDVVKLDVQGAEHRVVAGMRALLARSKPVLLVEFWPGGIRALGDDPHAALALYRELGFHVRVLDTPGLGTDPDDEELITATDARPNPPWGGFCTLVLER